MFTELNSFSARLRHSETIRLLVSDISYYYLSFVLVCLLRHSSLAANAKFEFFLSRTVIFDVSTQDCTRPFCVVLAGCSATMSHSDFYISNYSDVEQTDWASTINPFGDREEDDEKVHYLGAVIDKRNNRYCCFAKDGFGVCRR